MNYDEWLKSVPAEITGDSLWKADPDELAQLLQNILPP
jgi:hypothetical protein